MSQAVELLERDEALAALAEARDAAARGEGRVVFVTGEPGIGKTSLVTRFVRDLEAGARVLLGTCDDLSIPRPLGPFRDLVGSVSAALDEALAAGAAPHEIQALLIAELELPPRPTVLVLEDVHWADDATLDSITVLGRRIGSLPALLVLTFRGGEAPPGHPLHAALGAIRADDAVFLELAPLSRERGRLAGRRRRGRGLRRDAAATRSTSPSCWPSRTAAELPPSVANAVLGRASRLDDDARRLVELVSVVPNRVRTSVLDAVMPGLAGGRGGARAPAAARGRRRVRALPPRARAATRSARASRSRRGAACTPRSSRRCWPRRRSGRHRPPRGGRRARRTSSPSTRSSPPGARPRSSRTARRTRTTGAPPTSSTGCPPREQATVLEELAMAAYVVGRLERRVPGDRARDRDLRGSSATTAAVGRCTRVLSRFHWFAGDGDAARRDGARGDRDPRAARRVGRARRAYSGLSQLAMLAEDAEQAIELGRAGARARDPARRRAAPAPTRWSTSARAEVQLDHGETAPLLEAHAIADAAGRAPRGDARARQPRLHADVLGASPSAALALRASRRSPTREEHEVHNFVSYVATMIAWLRLRAGEWDEAERVARGEVERAAPSRSCSPRRSSTELAVRRGDADAAERLADARGPGRAHGRAAAHRAGRSSWRPSGR